MKPQHCLKNVCIPLFAMFVTALIGEGAPVASSISVSPNPVSLNGPANVSVTISKSPSETWVSGSALIFGLPPGGGSAQLLGSIPSSQYAYANTASTQWSPGVVGSWSIYAQLTGVYMVSGSYNTYSVNQVPTSSVSLQVNSPGGGGGPGSPMTFALEMPEYDGIPRLGFIVGYEMSSCCPYAELSDCELPLYTPYDRDDPEWWLNLVQEMLHSRVHIAFMHGRGCYSASPNPSSPWTMGGNGNMCPAHLQKLVDAIYLAGAQDVVRLAMWDDTGAYPGARNIFLGLPENTRFDLADTYSVEEVMWKRNIKLWFDTIPSSLWYRHQNGRPVIAMWSLSDAFFTNQQNYANAALNLIKSRFAAAFGVEPLFILDSTWIDEDTTVAANSAVIGVNNWFDPSHSTGNNTYTYRSFKNNNWGVAVPGFKDSPEYVGPDRLQPRYGGAALRNGLAAGEGLPSEWANLTLLEGMTNIAESGGFYKSADWTYPNQYLNIVREYSDRKTKTTRLEAEAADAFQHANPLYANVYRADGLNVVTSGAVGWSVLGNSANDWIGFADLFLSKGKYQFGIRGSNASGSACTVRIQVDGTTIGDFTIPASTTEEEAYVGEAILSHGNHAIRATFLNGGATLDWIFIRKADRTAAFRSNWSKYLVAERGGHDQINANRNSIGSWETFMLVDLNGGDLVSGDSVHIQTANGSFVVAEGGGGSTVTAERWSPGAWETFFVIKVSGGGTIVSGQQVALRTSNNRYVTAQAGGGVVATSTSIGGAETFTITLNP